MDHIESREIQAAVEEVAKRAEEIAKEMRIGPGDPAAEGVVGARLDKWYVAEIVVAVKEEELAALVESAELILRGLTDGLRAIDAGKTAAAAGPRERRESGGNPQSRPTSVSASWAEGAAVEKL